MKPILYRSARFLHVIRNESIHLVLFSYEIQFPFPVLHVDLIMIQRGESAFQNLTYPM